MNECLLNRTEKEQSLRLKVRQHVNPLSSKYQIPVNLPGTWMCEAFEDAQRPLIIDVGCAKGILGTSICLVHMLYPPLLPYLQGPGCSRWLAGIPRATFSA